MARSIERLWLYTIVRAVDGGSKLVFEPPVVPTVVLVGGRRLVPRFLGHGTAREFREAYSHRTVNLDVRILQRSDKNGDCAATPGKTQTASRGNLGVYIGIIKCGPRKGDGVFSEQSGTPDRRIAIPSGQASSSTDQQGQIAGVTCFREGLDRPRLERAVARLLRPPGEFLLGPGRV